VKRRGTAIRWRSSFDTVGHNLSGGSLHVSHSFALRAWPPPLLREIPLVDSREFALLVGLEKSYG